MVGCFIRMHSQDTVLRWQIFEAANQGMTTRQISDRIGVPAATIERWRKKYKIVKHPPYKGFPSKLSAVEADFKKLFPIKSTKDLALIFNVHTGTVAVWARKTGLKKNPRHKWDFSKHPRGATGLRLSSAAKAKMLAGSRRMWSNPDHIVNSKEYRNKMSARSSLMIIKRMREKPNSIYSHCKRGTRPDLGPIFFRSAWEANYARYLNWLVLNKQIHKWEYEPETFWFLTIKRGVRSYTPDFKIWEKKDAEPRFIEVKGWMDPKSKTKLKRMAKYYPNVSIMVVGAKEYNSLKKIAGLIPNWE